jgi:Phage integrase family
MHGWCDSQPSASGCRMCSRSKRSANCCVNSKTRGVLALYLALTTGLRVSELLALQWADVHFAAGEIRLTRGIVRQHIRTMKTEASRKPVPMDGGLADVLTSWRSSAPYNQNGDYIFASPDKHGKQPYWPNAAMEDHIRPAALRAGITKRELAHVSPHFRHFGEQRRRGRCDDAGTDAARERKHHDGQIGSGRDSGETQSAILHRAGDPVPRLFPRVDGYGCNWLNRKNWALNSAVECHLHTVEVIGSNPIAPTIPIFLRHSHLDLAVTFFGFTLQPDATRWSHCVDSEAGFILSN